jgi:hypothetical protein
MTAIRVIRQTLRPVRRIVETMRTRLVELPYLFYRPALGSRDWLIRSEVKYGGYISNVERRRVSPLDERTPEQLAFGGMTGGDRMLHHGYVGAYARYLAPFVGLPGLTVAEFGILKGTGLAIWCDLFPDARVLGFDIDLGHFAENRAALERRGAFGRNSPEVCEFDQLAPDPARLKADLGGSNLDIVIDDGLHSTEAIISNWRAVKPHLAQRCVYFVEDYAGLLDVCGDEFAGFDADAFGMMTVVSRGLLGK